MKPLQAGLTPGHGPSQPPPPWSQPSGTDGTPAGGGGGGSRGTDGRTPSSSSLQGVPLGPMLFVIHPTCISSLWKNHKLLRECYTIAWVGGPGPQARGTRGSRVNDLGVKGTISTLDSHPLRRLATFPFLWGERGVSTVS